MATFRFATGTSAGPRSLVWWAEAAKGEVYVGAREGWWKASLHRSGSWHLRAHAAPPVDVRLREDRILSRWKRPEEMFSGITAGISIVVPHESLAKHGPCLKKVVWCDPPDAGESAVLSVVLGAPRRQAELSSDAVAAGISIVGQLQVDADRRAWILHWRTKQDEHERQLWRDVLEDEARGDSWAMWRFAMPDHGTKIVVNGENRTARASRYLAELVVPPTKS